MHPIDSTELSQDQLELTPLAQAHYSSVIVEYFRSPTSNPVRVQYLLLPAV